MVVVENSITYFEYVSVGSDIQHLWPVWLNHIIPHYLINDTIFGEKKGS
jgi:hypothetical protein